MEFLRFGSSIPGSYWGCCACCIIQNFKVNPEDKASIELVDGDGGHPLGDRFYGKTYREIFEARIINGTFSDDEMPNHIFLAILTESQIHTSAGKAWLKILKQHGFEFIRTTDNSVYSGSDCDECEDCDSDSVNKNYLFGLFRNIGNGAVRDPFEPPKEWTDMEGGVSEISSFITHSDRLDLLHSREQVHQKMWDELTPVKFYSRKELEKDDIPIILAGRRSKYPQEAAFVREQREKRENATNNGPKKSGFAPCAASSSATLEAIG